MAADSGGQSELRIGVDVGGTFTDLVAVDPDGTLRVVKVPSTPPAFHNGVLEAVGQAVGGERSARIVHGSTVATNALLQRNGERAAMITTEGFRDLLLIGRQNRPKLYDLRVQRPRPVIRPEDCFTVAERISATGEVVRPLDEADVDRVLTEIESRGIRHTAVCLLFSFVNPDHERRIADACARRGLTCSISSEVLPEFREYERACTTAINASLRPTVEAYLGQLEGGLSTGVEDLRVMQSNGGTLTVKEAGESAVRLLLSGPAGGVIGAGYVAEQLGLTDVITYDMGGTSTDVATVLGGRAEWTTRTAIDGLPVGVPMFDIHTVGAGGGSVAYVDEGGALRVGPRSAGAIPGPACYGRGGVEPTVTDANLLLGRILPAHFLGGHMTLRMDLAERAVGGLAERLGKSPHEAALGVLRVVESNMEHAVRAVTSRRGHDPRSFTLVSFGGAGGLHACRLAESLEISRVLIPPYAGVLSALGMVVAPAIVDVSKTVLHLGEELDDSRLPAEFGYLSGLTADRIPPERTGGVEVFADVRFAGQSHELTVPVTAPMLENIEASFFNAYRQRYGELPSNGRMEVVTLRIRRTARRAALTLPAVAGAAPVRERVRLIDAGGTAREADALNRAALLAAGATVGPILLIDPEATAFVPEGWTAAADPAGAVLLTRAVGSSSEAC
jgi:N-methylhydantoinase A